MMMMDKFFVVMMMANILNNVNKMIKKKFFVFVYFSRNVSLGIESLI
jgi:hypothetical protein